MAEWIEKHLENIGEIEFLDEVQLSMFWKSLTDHLQSLNSNKSSETTTHDNLLSWIDTHMRKQNFKPCLQFLKVMESFVHLLARDNSRLSPLSRIIIFRICEKLWCDEVSGADQLTLQVIPHVVMCCLTTNNNETDFKRLWTFRGVFTLLDFQLASAQPLENTLIRCLLRGALKSRYGRKTMLYLLSLDNGIILSHALPSVKLAIYDAMQHDFGRQFGALLFELWKLEKARVESSCASGGHTQVEEILQNIASEATLAASPRHFRALRSVLIEFMNVNRSSKAVCGMIESIFRPILWRSLNCANASVRSQAAVLLFDGFPFQNADWSAEDSDQMMQRQFDAMTRLLKDSDHKVRAHAATGVSSVLVQYWQELPVATTRELLSHLIGKLACDSASADVRYAVISGLAHLLAEQPLAHGSLVLLLPHVGRSVHDQSEKVRLAVLSLLLKVKQIRDIRFYDVVPVDALLAQLAADRDRPAVCTVITELLLNSFFATSDADKDRGTAPSIGHAQVQRCLHFVRMHPEAAVAFYSCLYRHVSLGRIAKFLVILVSLLSASPSPAPDRKLKRGRSQQERNDPSDFCQEQGVDAASRVPLLRIVLVLLKSLRHMDEAGQLSAESTLLIAKYFTAEKLQCCTEAAVALLPQDRTQLLCIALWLKVTAEVGILLNKNSQIMQSDLSFDVDCRSLLSLTSKCVGGDDSDAKEQPPIVSLTDSLTAVALAQGQEEELLGFVSQMLDMPYADDGMPGGFIFAAALYASYVAEVSKGFSEVEVGRSQQSVKQHPDHFLCPRLFRLIQAHRAQDHEAAVEKSVQSLVIAALSKNNPESGPTAVAVVLSVFTSWCALSQHRALLMSHCHTGPFASDGRRALDWITVNVFGVLLSENYRRRELSAKLIGVALALVGDLLYLAVSSDSLWETVRQWFETLLATSESIAQCAKPPIEDWQFVVSLQHATLAAACRIDCLCAAFSNNSVGSCAAVLCRASVQRYLRLTFHTAAELSPTHRAAIQRCVREV